MPHLIRGLIAKKCVAVPPFAELICSCLHDQTFCKNKDKDLQKDLDTEKPSGSPPEQSHDEEDSEYKSEEDNSKNEKELKEDGESKTKVDEAKPKNRTGKNSKAREGSDSENVTSKSKTKEDKEVENNLKKVELEDKPKMERILFEKTSIQNSFISKWKQLRDNARMAEENSRKEKKCRSIRDFSVIDAAILEEVLSEVDNLEESTEDSTMVTFVYFYLVLTTLIFYYESLARDNLVLIVQLNLSVRVIGNRAELSVSFQQILLNVSFNKLLFSPYARR